MQPQELIYRQTSKHNKRNSTIKWYHKQQRAGVPAVSKNQREQNILKKQRALADNWKNSRTATIDSQQHQWKSAVSATLAAARSKAQEEATERSPKKRKSTTDYDSECSKKNKLAVYNNLWQVMKRKPVKNIGEANQQSSENPLPLRMKNEPIEWEKERKELDLIFEQQAKRQLKNLPRISKPSQFHSSVSLFDYQVDGISWLVQQETNPRPNPFVRKRDDNGTNAYYCRITQRRLKQQGYKPMGGAILADEMGLGKTIQCIALILSNPPAGHVYPPGEGSNNKNDDAVCTLVICPKSVIYNWEQQIQNFVRPNTFRVTTYDGERKKRSEIIDKLQENKYDILIVSYETIVSDYNYTATRKIGGDIYDAVFHRIILDEAQKIRNSDSITFRAVSEIQTKHKLCLTGTPFVNKPDDIYSLLRFVKVDPLADAKFFKEHVCLPIHARKRAGLARLRTAMGYAALRRTKDLANLTIVDKTVSLCRVDFSEGSPHKIIHDYLHKTAQAAVVASRNEIGHENLPVEDGSSVFQTVLRVRQACCHWKLVPKKYYTPAVELKERLEIPNYTTVTTSTTAYDCGQNCDHLSDSDSDFEESCTEDSFDDMNDIEKSPKICALLNSIEEMKANEKAVIFSQWTSFLDLIGQSLSTAGHKFARIDGTMSTTDRSNAMKSLEQDNSVRFMLASLMSAGTGINLTRANFVFVMDPWWNEATEAQAIDRVHRVGQTRPVRVIRFVMRGSIEERFETFKRGKTALGKGSMQRLSRTEEQSAKITCLKDLFSTNEVDAMTGWKF